MDNSQKNLKSRIKNYTTSFSTDAIAKLLWWGSAPHPGIFTSKNDWVEFLEAMWVHSKCGTGWEADDHSKNGYWLANRLAAGPIPT